ncbi:hypothetical protein [Hydrogenophaga sp.]|uniref:hypothetical protein n=1 Tax=Hydrogenophaga sp. TaxID=1904254 RepID=UPI00260550BA|nr:hypothetical protein [Hydrogenophaga sp.]MDM7950546.1 hypothetical protein [Hydrogenophaga sp.]
MHIYANDVEAVFERAVAAGATIMKQPVQESDADRHGGFTDAGGTTWWVSTQVD